MIKSRLTMHEIYDKLSDVEAEIEAKYAEGEYVASDGLISNKLRDMLQFIDTENRKKRKRI